MHGGFLINVCHLTSVFPAIRQGGFQEHQERCLHARGTIPNLGTTHVGSHSSTYLLLKNYLTLTRGWNLEPRKLGTLGRVRARLLVGAHIQDSKKKKNYKKRRNKKEYTGRLSPNACNFRSSSRLSIAAMFMNSH